MRAAYNHAKYLPQRFAMMRCWADYIDALRANTDPHVIRKVGSESATAAMRAFQEREARSIWSPTRENAELSKAMQEASRASV